MSETFIINTMYSERGHTLLVGDYPGLEAYIEETGAHDQDPPLYDVWKKGSRCVTPEEMPSNYHLHPKRNKNFADAFCIRNGIIVVSDRMKSLIEGLDPDLHQFFPINIIYRNGERSSKRYFTMHVTASKPTIFMNQPAVQQRSYAGIEYVHFVEPMSKVDPVIVNDEIAEGVHLWRDDFSKRTCFVSKKLLDEVKAQNLIFFRTYPTLLASNQLPSRPSLSEDENVPDKKAGIFQKWNLFKQSRL